MDDTRQRIATLGRLVERRAHVALGYVGQFAASIGSAIAGARFSGRVNRRLAL